MNHRNFQVQPLCGLGNSRVAPRLPRKGNQYFNTPSEYSHAPYEREGYIGRKGRAGVCGCGNHENRGAECRMESSRTPTIDTNRGCGCNQSSDRDCSKLLKQIQTVDFALYEVVLYLDAYPDHCEALTFYHKLLERRKMLLSSYEELCGPLTAWSNVSTTSWDWVKTPAPWEYSHD